MRQTMARYPTLQARCETSIVTMPFTGGPGNNETPTETKQPQEEQEPHISTSQCLHRRASGNAHAAPHPHQGAEWWHRRARSRRRRLVCRQRSQSHHAGTRPVSDRQWRARHRANPRPPMSPMCHLAARSPRCGMWIRRRSVAISRRQHPYRQRPDSCRRTRRRSRNVAVIRCRGHASWRSDRSQQQRILGP